METVLRIDRAGPLTSIQDAGRFGHLADGISASGPMDRGGFAGAGSWAGSMGSAGIEFSMLGMDLTIEAGAVTAGWDGGDFAVLINDVPRSGPAEPTFALGIGYGSGPRVQETMGICALVARLRCLRSWAAVRQVCAPGSADLKVAGCLKAIG